MMALLQRKVSPDCLQYPMQISRRNLGRKVFPALAPFPVELVEPVKADCVKHVTLCPDLNVGWCFRQRRSAQREVPAHDSGRLGSGQRHHSAELADVCRTGGDNHHGAVLQHFRGNKPAREITDQHMPQLGVEVIKRHRPYLKKQSRPKAALTDTRGSLLSPFPCRSLTLREGDSNRQCRTHTQSMDTKQKKQLRVIQYRPIQFTQGSKPRYTATTAPHGRSGLVASIQKAHSRASGFFVHVVRRVYGGLGRGSFGCAGFFVAGLPTLLSPSPCCLVAAVAVIPHTRKPHNERTHHKHTCNPY